MLKKRFISLAMTALFLVSTVVSVSAFNLSAPLYISDMTWISATCNSFFTGGVRRDTDIKGDSLNIAGVTYAKGFGSAACDTGKPDAEVKVTIPANYNYFEAIVGFDDRTLQKGSAEFKVLVNGVVVATTGIVLGNSGPHTISAAVTQGSTLSLVTTNGGDGAANDTVDWCNAALYIKTVPAVAITSPTGNVGSSNVTVSGTSSYVDAVKIFAGGVEKGEATLSPDGTWTYALQLASTGQTTIEAKGIVGGVEDTSAQVTVTYSEVTYISDMTWISATSHPSFPVKRDTDIKGDSLNIKGSTYSKGFGLAARDSGTGDAELKVLVPQGYNYFKAIVGFDDRTSAGSAEFKVLVDGVLVATTGIVYGGATLSAPHAISANVTPGSIITLVTTNGGDSAASDTVDWCIAALYSTTEQAVAFDTFDKTTWGNGDSAGNKAKLNFMTGRAFSVTLSMKVDKNLGRSTIVLKNEKQEIVASKKVDCFFVTSSWVDVTFIVESGGNYTLEITADGENYTKITNVQFNEDLGTAGNAVVIDGIAIDEGEI